MDRRRISALSSRANIIRQLLTHDVSALLIPPASSPQDVAINGSLVFCEKGGAEALNFVKGAGMARFVPASRFNYLSWF
ncbi:hypothetical protein J6590_074599 [Homalodisca vitripennis]|nr:hypothetical protein J6590_074599 [Homalodisca vitripennis]